MFEAVSVDNLDVVTCADALAASVVERRRAGARRLALAAHWADLHPAPVAVRREPVHRGLDEVDRPGGRRIGRRDELGEGIRLGAEGTPMVQAFCGVELGVLLETTTVSAECLLRDALELRHRLPRVWAAVMAGEVEDWQAREAAKATRVLTAEQAGWVDAEILDALVGLPFGRALEVIEAKVIAADPEAHEARRAKQAAERYVAKGRRRTPAGLQTLIAQTTPGDVARVDAMIDHLATALGTAGDTDSQQVRRAKALALLAQPALACLFLATQADARPGSACTTGSDMAPEPEQCSDPCPEPAGEPDAPAPSAVELAVAFGKVLAEGGARVLDRLRGRTVLYLHLAEEALATQAGAHPGSRVARAEGLGPLSLPQLREWLGTDTVVVRPVLDPTGLTPVDSYEIPRDLAEALTLRDPFEVFPWGTLGSRHADCDHTKPYRPPGAPGDDGGPPGQTGLHNLGPLARTHHRAKTFGGFACYQPVPGLYFWRLPSGHWYQVDHTGTYALGRAAPPILEAQDPRHGSSAMRRLDAHFAERIDFALAT